MNFLYLICKLNINLKYWKEPINMDKKFIEREKTFNQKEYQKEYRQKMYKQLKFEVKHDFYEMFNNYCTDNGINKAELFRIAVIEYIENH